MSWLTSEQALDALGTKPQSLYASVSRGRIRTKADPDDPRRRLYYGDDVERLAGRGAGRRRTETIASEAIRWGDPVLASAITAVTGGRLYYRGRDAVTLAETAGLEEVAALLWEAPVAAFSTPPLSGRTPGALGPAFALLAARAATDPPATRQPPDSLTADAATIVGGLAGALGAMAGDAPVHRRLASAWRRPETAGLLRRALVLLADHELNASAFAARVTASTGASLAASALSGLATLSGPLHGGAAAAVTGLAQRILRDGGAELARDWAGGRALPGFGHRLYPEGDIRAAALLPLFPLPPAFAALARIGSELSGEEPNVDFALAALAAAFDLPPEAPLQLFALARSTGWLAHALEQISTGTLIRPRALYVGNSPEAGDQV